MSSPTSTRRSQPPQKNRLRRIGLWDLLGLLLLAGAVGCFALATIDFLDDGLEEVKVPYFPDGFYHGKAILPSRAVTQYGVYVPPQFRGQSGPFPMIVFLHGFGERTKETLLWAGLPKSIHDRLRNQDKFDFIGFFPIDPTGVWASDSRSVRDSMEAMDLVMRRHRVDRNRLYLTGISNGGTGVWNLAAAYPDRWAALAPVASFIAPDVASVRHIPCWIFHGGADKEADVEMAQKAYRDLKTAGSDVHYREFEGAGHTISEPVYNRKLFEWFARHKKQ